MNITVTYKRTRRRYHSFVRQVFWRGDGIYLMFQSILVAVLCWVCAVLISQLYEFFSPSGVVDMWYHIFVTLPIALLLVPGLIRLAKRVIEVKHVYTGMYESCPIHDDKEVDVEVKIDDDGIGFGKEEVQWEEMILGFATKDFYVFLSRRPVIVGMPKYAVDAELGKYLMKKMQIINERIEGRVRRGKRG